MIMGRSMQFTRYHDFTMGYISYYSCDRFGVLSGRFNTQSLQLLFLN